MNHEDYFKTAPSSKVHTAEPPMASVENRTDIGGITTERQKVNNDILQLNENKTDNDHTTNDVVMTNTCSGNTDGSKTQRVEISTQLSGNTVSIPDYEELTPKQLLKHDTRTTWAYLKDLIIVEHQVVSLVFRKSIKEPLFIRAWMLVFSLSMQFAFNALMYTDDVIDKRQADKKDVFLYINLDWLSLWGVR
jgi:hypothetical protein